MLNDQSSPVYGRAAAQEARSGLAVPLMRDGRVLGTLMVARNQISIFPDKQVNLLQTFADQAVISTGKVDHPVVLGAALELPGVLFGDTGYQ